MPQRSKTLEFRLKTLEEMEAIKRLKHQYCFALDRRDWERVAGLFAADGTADYGPIGKKQGRKAIFEFFRDVISKNFTFFCHMAHNPIIELHGKKRATGGWYFEIPATIPSRRARWITGWYEDEYIKEDGEWKFLKVKSSYFYISSYEKGWGKEPFIKS